MPNDPNQPEPPGESISGRIDRICDQFEAAWQSGQRPRIEDYLGEVPEEEQAKLFEELLGIEIERLWPADRERPGPDRYQSRFPQFQQEIDAAFAKLAAIAESGNKSLDSTLGQPTALHIRCPHCRNAIELVNQDLLAEITCPSCGSKFSLAGDATLEHHAGEATPGRRRQRIAHFELIERLGMGAFGSV